MFRIPPSLVERLADGAVKFSTFLFGNGRSRPHGRAASQGPGLGLPARFGGVARRAGFFLSCLDSERRDVAEECGDPKSEERIFFGRVLLARSTEGEIATRYGSGAGANATARISSTTRPYGSERTTRPESTATRPSASGTAGDSTPGTECFVHLRKGALAGSAWEGSGDHQPPPPIFFATTWSVSALGS
jgi:hypothetical protein